MELRANLTQRAGEDLLDVGEAQPGQLGDLGTGELAAEAERDELALALAKLLERRSELRGEPNVRILA